MLEKDIIKYIAPLLYWNKNSTIENNSNKVKQITNLKSNKIKSSKPPKIVKIVEKPKFNKGIKQKRKRQPISVIDSEEEFITDNESYDSEEELVTDNEYYDSDEELIDESNL